MLRTKPYFYNTYSVRQKVRSVDLPEEQQPLFSTVYMKVMFLNRMLWGMADTVRNLVQCPVHILQ